MQCKHCGNRPAVYGHRGLCQPCWRHPRIRGRYDRALPGEDMTAEQVEALVAEQMKCLPPWWAEESAKEVDARPYGRVLGN